MNNVDNYGWSLNEPPDSCSYITPWILNYIANKKITSIIDVGCGNGALCREILKHNSNLKVIGIDNDEKGINIAKHNCPNGTFYRLGIHESNNQIFNNKTFDFIISTEVIEHLYSPQQLITFCYKYLKDNGELLITCPYHGYWKNLIISILGEWDIQHTTLWEGGHIKFWSKKTITTLLNDNGFKITLFTGVGRIRYIWKSMIVIAKKL